MDCRNLNLLKVLLVCVVVFNLVSAALPEGRQVASHAAAGAGKRCLNALVLYQKKELQSFTCKCLPVSGITHLDWL